MKIAVLSDIHSNVFALEAVIDDAERHGVEQMLNLGDIFYGPIAPKATYDLLKRYDFITIQGNQDRQLYEVAQEEANKNPTLQFVIEDLGEEPIAWAKSLPFENQVSNEIYMCHGSPTSDLEYLLEDIKTGLPCIRSDSEILASLNGQSSDVILCGHTHIPRTVKVTSGQLIINPGSVGLPSYTDDEPTVHAMENYSYHASYSIIEKTKRGWAIQQMKVPYDYHRAVDKVKDLNRDDWKHYLSTGRGG